MPVVFVHGVATRRSPAYERSSAQRSALLRSFLAPALRVPTDALTVLDAYWGDAASTFAWGHASLPGGGEERFGTAAPEESPVLASACAAHPETAAHAPLTAVARTCLADAIDLLWTASSERALAAEAVELAELAVAAASYADRHADPSWLAAVTDDRVFLDRLLARLPARTPEADPATEIFGGSGRRAAVGRLREGLARIAAAAPRAATTGLVSVGRSRTHRAVSRFLGDVLSYLRQREQHGADGAIARVIAETIEAADRARTDTDPRLVIVAHSMGGNIVYDLLSCLRPDLACDSLVTVGSQVGVFAELDLFRNVVAPADPRVDRVPALPNLGRWVNVFDPDDVMAFVVGGIFDNVEDYRYSTGAGLLGAHSAYFLRPSFHRLLAARVAPPPESDGGGQTGPTR
ncbi:hypothetical protein [Embleya sp. NPDC059237]|uniref:hypothetical protein n=1 Tax=Embleya sp. NPDC059237 TaxID=3346784 RepID=UPI00369CC680